jgi:hypothetical protein
MQSFMAMMTESCLGPCLSMNTIPVKTFSTKPPACVPRGTGYPYASRSVFLRAPYTPVLTGHAWQDYTAIYSIW